MDGDGFAGDDAGPDTAGTLDQWYIFKAYVTSFKVTGGYSCP